MRSKWAAVSSLVIALMLVLGINAFYAQPTAQVIKGTHANAWSAAAVLVNGTSASLDTAVCDSGNSSMFGNTSAAATLTVQFSQDNTNFYTSATNSGAVTGNFGVSFIHGARYIRLISNAAVTITATLACH